MQAERQKEQGLELLRGGRMGWRGSIVGWGAEDARDAQKGD